ncbi:serine hydrolase [Corynebacterium felinum]|uniref:Beta-lactamase n=1 Tax=Corynebacterium felinum TaxID=131318 RepID=A0ABU2BAD4_9CORY|nr:serine hydrolase [Corynebacterium felinum]MDF5819707.1 serine hydrolase [Corynebacterium felinum]MDR7355576.1 CubicO group peptidase (beta-lactamase class C family) [Corynebacterium felinum]WJY94926.1 D-alanyl-D-alanine-carboxypeptidase/endopeptidase AmpH precursor [Corynebacterium felinum]
MNTDNPHEAIEEPVISSNPTQGKTTTVRTRILLATLGIIFLGGAGMSVVGIHPDTTVQRPVEIAAQEALTGDERATGILADALSYHSGNTHAMAVVFVNTDGAEAAFLRATPTTRFEIGSLSKLLTAQLYRRALAEQKITPTTTLGEIFPEEESDIKNIKLVELFAHTSGLSAWGANTDDAAHGHTYLDNLGNFIYRDSTTSDLLQRAREDARATKGQFHYSNLGIALLGQALAKAQDMEYAQLLRTEITGPLSLPATTVLVTEAHNPPVGFNQAQRPLPPSTFGAFAPAGGLGSSARDLGRFTRYLLDQYEQGKIPVPSENSSVEIFEGFNKATLDGTLVLRRSGTTAGFRSQIILDPVNYHAMIMLSDTNADITELAENCWRNRYQEDRAP